MSSVGVRDRTKVCGDIMIYVQVGGVGDNSVTKGNATFSKMEVMTVVCLAVWHPF